MHHAHGLVASAAKIHNVQWNDYDHQKVATTRFTRWLHRLFSRATLDRHPLSYQVSGEFPSYVAPPEE